MNGPNSQKGICPREIRMLTFTVQGVRMGIDAEQITEVMEAEEAEKRGLTVRPFHEKIAFGATSVQYNFPKAIMIKRKEGPYAVLIDEPEDITSVDVRSIQPMPPLIAGNGAMRLFWGAIPDGEGIILLIDFLRLKEEAEEEGGVATHRRCGNEDSKQ